MGENLLGLDEFALKMADAGKAIGESTVRNAVLKWATENHEALHKAGLVESLLKVCAE